MTSTRIEEIKREQDRLEWLACQEPEELQFNLLRYRWRNLELEIMQINAWLKRTEVRSRCAD